LKVDGAPILLSPRYDKLIEYKSILHQPFGGIKPPVSLEMGSLSKTTAG
jgi:hypothetical protein